MFPRQLGCVLPPIAVLIAGQWPCPNFRKTRPAPSIDYAHLCPGAAAGTAGYRKARSETGASAVAAKREGFIPNVFRRRLKRPSPRWLAPKSATATPAWCGRISSSIYKRLPIAGRAQAPWNLLWFIAGLSGGRFEWISTGTEETRQAVTDQILRRGRLLAAYDCPLKIDAEAVNARVGGHERAPRTRCGDRACAPTRDSSLVIQKGSPS
jgi:hypothetical protein